jgi:hypothetical protein
MRFKEFLLVEFGFSDSGSDWFYGSYLYPSDAFDWEDAVHAPPDFKFLKSRWERERKLGRKFYNLDIDKVLASKFTSVYSNTMPEAGEGQWKHRPDTRPNLTVDADARLDLHGIRKTAESPFKLSKSNNLIDNTDKLNKMFGKFEPKYPAAASDRPFTNRYEK